MYGDFPARNTVCTPYIPINGSGQPYLFLLPLPLFPRQDPKLYARSIGVHDEEDSFASEQLRNAVRRYGLADVYLLHSACYI